MTKKIKKEPEPSMAGFQQYCKERHINMDFPSFEKHRGEHYSAYLETLKS